MESLNDIPVENLLLWDSKHGTQCITKLSTSLVDNKTLKKLSIRYCYLNTQDVQKLSHAFLLNVYLQELNISLDVVIDDESAMCLGELLKSNTTLKALSLYSCKNISDTGIFYLCAALKLNSTLLKLNVSFNSITQDGVHHIADMLKKNRSLQTLMLLVLPDFSITVTELFEAMITNSTLKKLIVSNEHKNSYDTFHDHEVIKDRVTFTSN